MASKLDFSAAIDDLLQSQEEWEASQQRKEQALLDLISSDTSDEPEDELSASETNDEEKTEE